MKETYIIYKYTNKSNNKAYVGQTKQGSMKARAGTDGISYEGCPYFYSAIRTYGFEAFRKEILATCKDKQSANELEDHYILKFNTNNPDCGYNLRLSTTPILKPSKNKMYKPIESSLPPTLTELKEQIKTFCQINNHMSKQDLARNLSIKFHFDNVIAAETWIDWVNE